MFPGKARVLNILYDRSTYPSKFIGSNAHADSAAADQYPERTLLLGDGACHKGGIVGIVDAHAFFGTQIKNRMTSAFQVARQLNFQVKAPVIAGDRDPH